MSLTSIDIELFESIAIDAIYIYFGNKQRVPRNRKLTIYNQIKGYLNSKYKDKGAKLDEWLADKYNVAYINATVCNEWELALMRAMKPNLYATLMRVRRKTHTKLELFMVVDDGVLEKVCDSGLQMYRAIKEYCLFWDKGNQFCLEHQITNPAHLTMKEIQLEISEAMQNKLIPEISNIRVLGNDTNQYSLAYYDLNCGSLTRATPAWDTFLSQMVTDSCRRLFRAWVYSVFVGGNKGRQVMWLHGVGETGKTVIANTIYARLQRLNPNIVTSLERGDDMDKFSAGTYVDKRFALAADTKDKAIVRNNLVKNLTGGDVISNRAMGKSKEDAKVYCKIMVTSNAKPFINTESPEELSRLILISLVPEQCVDAKRSWHDRALGDFETMLADEIDDFIRQSKDCYLEFLKDDGHNLKDYDGHAEELDDTAFYVKRDLPVWWNACVEYTGNPKDTLKTKDLAYDYNRFLMSEMKVSWGMRFVIQSFCVTFLRESKIPIEELNNFNVLFIRGYKFKIDEPKQRPTAKAMAQRQMIENVTDGNTTDK